MSNLPALPSMNPSPWLARACEEYARPHPEAPPPPVAPSVIEEARLKARAMRPRLEPASHEQWARFLQPVVAAVRNPPSPDDFRAFISVASAGLSNIPAELLTPARQAEALRRWEFWPSVAEISGWLAPEARGLHATHAALCAVALSESRPKPAIDRPTPEEMAANKAAIAEMRANWDKQHRPERVTPHYLTREQLLASYEALAAQGNQTVAGRIKALKESP